MISADRRALVSTSNQAEEELSICSSWKPVVPNLFFFFFTIQDHLVLIVLFYLEIQGISARVEVFHQRSRLNSPHRGTLGRGFMLLLLVQNGLVKKSVE